MAEEEETEFLGEGSEEDAVEGEEEAAEGEEGEEGEEEGEEGGEGEEGEEGEEEEGEAMRLSDLPAGHPALQRIHSLEVQEPLEPAVA